MTQTPWTNTQPKTPDDYQELHNLSRTSTVKRRELPKDTLGERIMGHVPDAKSFTGQVHVEVHCKDGIVCDVYISTRRKM
jgi:hypothetical protein